MRFRPWLVPKSVPTVSRRNMQMGEIVAGRKAHYRLIEVLQEVNNKPTVLKAEVLQHERHSAPASCVIIKTAAAGHENSRDGLVREYNTYQKQGVAISQYIRAMYDVVGDPQDLDDAKRSQYPGLVLEWFDTTLQDVPPDRFRYNLVFLQAVAHAVLSSSAALNSNDLINTDIKPDNILISGLDDNHPIVKIGDLGSVHSDNEVYECQPFAMRAPEVWRGLTCLRQSEVWALAAMLLVWINPRILGASGVIGYITPEIWSIAKLMQLFPGWKGPPSNRDLFPKEFKVAEMLSVEPDPEILGEKLIKTADLETEMQTMQIPVALRDLLRTLLILNPEKRPSPAEVLASDEYLALAKAAKAFTESKG